jgi:hypothetical protein
MIRMLIIGYVFAIRSERQICREVQVSLAYWWFCNLGLEYTIPDHSGFSRARNGRFPESHVLRRVFERIVETGIEKGLVSGGGVAVDASLIEADANRQPSIAGVGWKKQIDPMAVSRAVKEYLSCRGDRDHGEGRHPGGRDGGGGALCLRDRAPEAGDMLRPHHQPMGGVDGDFERGAADGAEESLKVISPGSRAWQEAKTTDRKITCLWYCVANREGDRPFPI